MRQQLVRFLLAGFIYYVGVVGAPYLFVLPSGVIRLTSFLPPIFGLMWGPVAAWGVFFGELATDNGWLELPRILEESGLSDCMLQAAVLAYRGASWAFLSAYLPYRLWHSIFVSKRGALFGFTKHTFLKFILVVFISVVTTSLFMGLTTDEPEFIRLLDRRDRPESLAVDYALLMFIDDFDMAIMFGMPLFLTLLRYSYGFYRPNVKSSIRLPWSKWVDIAIHLYYIAVMFVLFLPYDILDGYMGARFLASLPLFLLCFRPLSQVSVRKGQTSAARISRARRKDIIFVESHIYALFVLLFVLLDVSGVIRNLDSLGTWWLFNSQILTFMVFTFIVLSLFLLHYRNSIMMRTMLLIVDLVFISTFVLGGIGLVTVNRILDEQARVDLQQIGRIETEHLSRSFDSIQQSVGSMRDFAMADLESYDRLVEDDAYREAYIRHMEKICLTIAENTEGAVSFYLRLAPEIAREHVGFLWSSNGVPGDEGKQYFQRYELTDISKYDEDDIEHVGWYYIPVKRKTATWMEPYYNRNMDIYMISYVIPLYDHGRILGIVGMDVNFDRIVQEIRRMTVYRYGYVYLIDREGRVLYHKDYQPGDIPQPSADTREFQTYLSNGMRLVVAGSVNEIYAERNNMMINLIVGMLLVALVLSLLSIWLVKRGIRPLVMVTKAAESIAAGNLDVDISYQSENELGRLVKSIREMVSKLEIYVYHDKLTGVRNASACMRMAKEIDERSKREEISYAVVVFDANGLKRTNDRYGHEAGNELIRRAAGIICHVFAHSPVFRVGGDEFVAILEHHDYEHRDALMTEFFAAMDMETIPVEGGEIPVSVASGIGIYRAGECYSQVFQRADEAMYRNKAEIKERNRDA